MAVKCYEVKYSIPGATYLDPIICKEREVKEELERRFGEKVVLISSKEISLGGCKLAKLTAQDLINLLASIKE